MDFEAVHDKERNVIRAQKLFIKCECDDCTIDKLTDNITPDEYKHTCFRDI